MSKKKIRNKMPKCTQCSASLNFVGNEEYGDNISIFIIVRTAVQT